MKKLIGFLLACIGGIVVVLFLIGFVGAMVARATKGRVPGRTILEVNLETPVTEDAPDDPFARLVASDQANLRDIVDAIDKAGTDNRVVGILARIGAGGLSLAQSQEVRDAIQGFRAKKKFAIAWSETFGEFSPGNGGYYLASGFDEIWLQPSGDIGLTGIMLETMFLRGVFDKLGMVPRFDHRWEYKNAMDQFTEKKMTPAMREAMGRLKDSWFSQLVRGIGSGRKMTEEQVKALVDKAPFLGKEAVDAKLVDGLAYRDEVYAKAKEKGGGAKLLYLSKYLERAGRPHSSGKVVALIYGLGGVHRGKSEYDALQGDQSMGSDTVTAAFRSAIDDKDVKAILFRVDSPGGSYVASDAIWRETVRAKQAGKPVIVSMSSVAGSGGYFVAMSADKIVAQPATITGSIGVLGGKFLTNGLWDKLGPSWDEVHSGAHATMFSGTHDYSKEEWDRFEAWLDRVYADFTGKVAEGRHMPKEKVLEVAKGRIWTGEDAKQNGLVDEVGGYGVAIKLVKQSLKLSDAEDIELRHYPRRKTAFEALMAKLSGDEGENSENRQTEVAARLIETIRPAARALRSLGVGANRGVLSMPEFQLSR